MKTSLNRWGLTFGLACILALAACGGAGAPQAVETPALTPLRFTALPILDALPVLVAQRQGYFANHGVAVEFIPVGSAPQRDQLIAAEQADGMITEVHSSILQDKDEIRVQVARTARAATADAALFRILASSQSGITSVDGLKGAEIGISNGTVIEYLTERLLQEEGFRPDEIKTVAVPNIADRLALLTSGGIPAVMLPDPLASLAVQQGAVLVLDDTAHPEYSFSVMTFRKAFLDANPDAARGFLAAVEEAVAAINQDPDQWKPLLGERQIVPPPLMESFHVPSFATAGVPSEAQYADIQAWLKEKGLLDQDVAYADVINPSFLP